MYPTVPQSLKNPVFIPDGIQSILNACHKLYPTQTNPRQVMAQVKFWLGGPHPLDYVTIYHHEGKKGLCVSHWHYVSMGLSDLHGDGRVHDRRPSSSSSDELSGFGFELSFRLKVKIGGETPPLWPVELLQSIASNIFSSRANFKPGDYITWNSPIDKSQSCILTQLFIIEDPKLSEIQTKVGRVSFFQIVPASMEELNAAQSWNVMGVVDLMRESILTGGPYQVCDNGRTKTLYQINTTAMTIIKQRLKSEGNNFSGFSTECHWFDSTGRDIRSLTPVDLLQTGYDSNFASSSTQLVYSYVDHPELKRIREITIALCVEAFLLLPLVLRGRLQHGRHFTFRSSNNEIAITLVPEGQEGTLVSPSIPYVAKSCWLQMYTPVSLLDEILIVADNFYSEYTPEEKVNLKDLFPFPKYSLILRIDL
ncbi:Suppressor of fused-like protein isoform X2 [Oopsacas minuta]|uniref:Suppressor of fused-like protein isoform X2 n=1 Tax=Oopsacas minuta TaxID=111878 RepID=A0AAV7JV18_9METZ|nr:Suppressor of fused-like protein isoform X2 [Oopsacas minuta]